MKTIEQSINSTARHFRTQTLFVKVWMSCFRSRFTGKRDSKRWPSGSPNFILFALTKTRASKREETWYRQLRKGLEVVRSSAAAGLPGETRTGTRTRCDRGYECNTRNFTNNKDKLSQFPFRVCVTLRKRDIYQESFGLMNTETVTEVKPFPTCEEIPVTWDPDPNILFHCSSQRYNFPFSSKDNMSYILPFFRDANCESEVLIRTALIRPRATSGGMGTRKREGKCCEGTSPHYQII